MFDDAQEYVEQKEKTFLEDMKKARKYEREVEKRRICSCGSGKRKLRWIRDGEFYCCYECFMEGLRCESDVMVPPRRTTSMEEYMSEPNWDDLWELNE